MPRRPRLVIAGIPLHVTQRGVNRAAIFLDQQDHRLYLELLAEVAAANAVSVHAYALMSNHVHLFITPDHVGDLARAMRLLNQRYVGTFNRRHRRTGTLWESRFRSSLVDSERYALTLYRYIELNPVRAAMVDAAQRYPWSSARTNLGIDPDPRVTPHPSYTALGHDIVTRTSAYGDWLRSGVTNHEIAAIRIHLQQERALGCPHFQTMVARTLNRPVTVRPRGRPRAHESEDSNG
jgi:putative transposase